MPSLDALRGPETNVSLWWALEPENHEDEGLEAVIYKQRKWIYKEKGMEQTCKKKQR